MHSATNPPNAAFYLWSGLSLSPFNLQLRRASPPADRPQVVIGRAQVESSRIECGGFAGNVTVSIGIAERSASIHDADALLKVADQAVYAAKAAGRNRCRLFGPGDWSVRSARAQ